MANEDQTSTDEPADQTPTPEELQAAELAKTRQALLVSAAMQQSEAQLPNALPTRAAPIASPSPPMTGTQPPPGAPQGRMYMGPASGSALDRFTAGQGPSNVNLMPPPAPMPPQAQAAMQGRLAAATGGESDPAALSRLQAADVPGARTLAVRSELPYSDASLSNERNAMLYGAMKKFDAGDRSPEVMATVLGKTASAGKRYNVAGVGLVDENGRVITPHPDSTQTRMVQGVGLVDANTGKVIVPSVQKPETKTVTKKIPAVAAVPGTPAQAARSGFLGIGARPAIPATPGVPAQDARTETSKVPVEAPAADTASIPKAFVAYLKAHPESAQSFDQKYGKGSAASILNQ